MKTIAFVVASFVLCEAAVAAPVDYAIDPMHTFPSFEADHMGLSYWRGKVTKTSGRVTLDRAAGTGSVVVDLDPASVDFGLKAMNDQARKPMLFDVKKYPKAAYRGTLVDFVDGQPTRVTGLLTLRGVTAPVDLTIDRFKCLPHPMLKRELCGANAVGTFRRDAFGMDAGKEYGFDMNVALRIQVEAIATK